MAAPREIERWRRILCGETREALSRRLAAEFTNTDSEAHIAAKELIAQIDHQRAEDQRRAPLDLSQAQHQERQRSARFSVRVSVAGLLLALVSFLSGRFWPTSQVSSLERRVTAIEQTLSSSPTTHPQPPTAQIPTSPKHTLSSTPVASTPSPTAATTPAPKTTP